mgnify:CR=1 FL=1
MRGNSCFQWFKDTNSKANHNVRFSTSLDYRVVFNGSKILIRKQITTYSNRKSFKMGCFQWFKDTNSKANHNYLSPIPQKTLVVFNGSKILIRKQITTLSKNCISADGCFQWFKDTNSKANHNIILLIPCFRLVVFNGSKILIRKQITTYRWKIKNG